MSFSRNVVMGSSRLPDRDLAKMYLAKFTTCEQRKIPFLLSFSEYKALQNRKLCAYTGIKLTYGDSTGSTLSLDRISPTVGYTRENTVAVCYAANRAKNKIFEQPGRPDMSVRALRRMCDTLGKLGFEPRQS